MNGKIIVGSYVSFVSCGLHYYGKVVSFNSDCSKARVDCESFLSGFWRWVNVEMLSVIDTSALNLK
jgi:hypothetical protein